MTTEKIRIVIAEDHEIVRDGIRMIVNAEPDMEVVGEAADGHAALELCKEVRPDIVLMDISMPVLNGLTAAATLKRTVPEIAILTLTRHHDEAYLQEMFQAGVSGYVLKQSASRELTRAIRAIAAGDTYLDPALAQTVFSSFSAAGKSRSQSPTKLTERESEVLRHVVLGYSATEIAEILDISAKTVQVHKNSSMTKLGLTNRRDLVRYGLLRGWLTDE